MDQISKQDRLKLYIILLSAVFLIAGWEIFDRTVDRSGWVQRDGSYSYLDFHGRKITGWLQLDDRTYYFGEDHLMHTGWLEENGEKYHFGTDGIMNTGWTNVDSMRCYFHSDGHLHTGWLHLNDKDYYLEETGAMVSGWLELPGSTHYFGENGALLRGWQQLEGNTYYFREDRGTMVTGEMEMDGNLYRFGHDGILFTGWDETEEGRVYYAPDGPRAFGWTQIDGNWYYFGEDGIARTGWYQDGEYTYYLHEDGAAAVGPTEIDGETYYFTPKGIMVVLVNGDHPVPDYFELELESYIPWHQVASVALEPMTRMLEDCLAAGYEYEFNSAYRSIHTQQEILNLRTEEYQYRGYPKDQAYLEARKSVALPGTSEHHLGLAVDILNKDKAEKEALQWLGEHCWEYGFILRYPEEKASITGIIYEPWHFRYVGTRVSMDMKDSGLCLEEYLGAASVENSAIEDE